MSDTDQAAAEAPAFVSDARLPDWATAVAPGIIRVDADAMYPAMLAVLGATDRDITQYDLECCFQFMKMDLQIAVRNSNTAPVEGGALRILVEGGKETWAQRLFPPGRGVAAAMNGEAKTLYRHIRGYTP